MPAGLTTGLALALLVSLPASSAGQARDSTSAPDSLGPIARAVGDPSSPSPAQVRTPMPLAAQEQIHAITTAFFDTPNRMGLLPTGMAEAEIAAAYVRLAGRDSTNVGAMSGGMIHVLHAIDPDLTGGGAGLGYGFRRAAEGVRTAIQLATSVEGAPESLLYHAPFIESAATGAMARADDAVALARQIQGSTDAASTLRLVDRLAAVVRSMTWGEDRDGDGRIGADASEAGLAQALYHLELVRRMEGPGR